MRFNASYQLHQSGMYHVTLSLDPLTIAVDPRLFWETLRSNLRAQHVEDGSVRIRLDQVLELGFAPPDFWFRYEPREND